MPAISLSINRFRVTGLLAITASVSLVGAALLVGAPTASAEVIQLDNGMTVDTGTENPDGSRRITVTSVGPGDDIINVGSTGHEQFEREVSGHTSSFIVNREQTQVSVQECQKRGLFPIAHCAKISSFSPYPVAPVQAPPGQEAPPPLVMKFPDAEPPKDLTVSSRNGDQGVTIKIVNRTAGGTQCSYSSDLGEGSVAVPANASAEIFIAAQRQFADHPGTVTCDNGMTANAFARY